MSAAARPAPRGLAARPVLANSAALIVLRATNLVARMAVLFTVAHAVPPAAFGMVVLALSVAEIGKAAADFGMDTLAIRTWAGEVAPAQHARFAATLAAGKLVFGVVAYAGLAAWFAWKGPADQARIGVIVGLTALTASLINFSLDWFQARLRIGRVFVPVLVSNALLTGLALLLVPRLPSLAATAALFPALELVNGVVLLVLLRGEGLWQASGLDFAAVPELVRACLPIAATGLLVMLYSRLDVLILSSRLDATAVGNYGIAFRLTEPVQIAAAAFGLSVYSRFSAWFADAAPGAMRRHAVRYSGAALAYGIVCALALELLAPPVIHRFFPDYAPAVPILRVLAAAVVFRALNATLGGIIQGAGRFRLLTGIALWNLAVIWLLLAWLIGREGARGAALALLAGEGLNTLIQLTVIARLTGPHGREPADGA